MKRWTLACSRADQPEPGRVFGRRSGADGVHAGSGRHQRGPGLDRSRRRRLRPARRHRPALRRMTGRPCLDGTFGVGAFSVVGANGKTATGDGGGLVITFANGSLPDGPEGEAGRRPSSWMATPASSSSTVGSTAATTTKGKKVTFKVTKSTGSVILRDKSGQEQKRPASQFAGVMGPAGSGTVTCTDDGVTLKTSKQEFTLTR